MEPTATSDNSDAAEYQARLACERRCAVPGHCVCTAWENFLPAARQGHLDAVSLRAGRPVAPDEFDVVATRVVQIDLRRGYDRQNERLLAQVRGVPASPATPERDADPGNPNVAGPTVEHVLIRSPGDLNDPQLAAGLRSSFDQTAAAYRRDGAVVVGPGEFSLNYGETAVEAPRPPALPEHPAIEITLALRRASAMDRQRKIAAQLLVDLGVSDQTFDDAARRHDMELGGVGFHESRKGILGSEARAVFDAVLAEILA